MFPKYLEDKHPRSGADCSCTAAYYNAMIGRNPTPFADYAQTLRRRHYDGDWKNGWLLLAELIETFYGEQRNLVFFDLFPGNKRLYRIDERTTAPSRGWKLDQDRRCRDDVKLYDETGCIW